jgi:hypothetical protein
MNKINSTDYIQQLLKTISPEEKIEINILGEIKVIHRDITGKKKSKKMGNLFQNIDESPVVKFRTTSFVSINTVGFKHYREDRKRIVKDYNSDLVIGIYETILEMGILPVIPGNYTDNNHIKYTTKKVGDFIGYYAYDKLQFVDKISNNRRYYHTENLPKLNTQKFKNLDEVK